MSRKNAGNKQMDRAMTTATTTKATTILSSMLVVLVLLLLLIAGQVAVEAFVGGLSRSCLPFDIQRRCVLPVSLAATQRDDPQQQAEAEDSPENKKHVAFFAATTTTLVDHNDKGDYKDDDSDDSWKTGFGKNVEYLSLTLKQHKPLGCTVEESLSSVAATTTDQKKSNKQKKKKTESLHYVFVTKVVEGGNADHAGILPGDVIIGVTATFGGGPTGAVENVAGLGMNKVKNLVAARPSTEPLQLRIARGTNVVQEHEVALSELCSNGAANDMEIENCVLEYLQSGYHDNRNNVNRNGRVPETIDDDDKQEECDPTMSDEDCLLDQMYSMWADDMSITTSSPSNGKTAAASDDPSSLSLDAAASPKKQVIKPWSSRSSPSGTWVRDPKTGEMRNIDAE